MQQQRLVAVIVMGIAALMVILSVFVLGWRSMEQGSRSASFKLRSLETCHRSECRTYDYEKDKMKTGEGKAMYWSTLLTFIFGILWAGLLTTAAIVSGVAKTADTIRGICWATFGFSIWMALVGIANEIVMGWAIKFDSSVGVGFILFLLAAAGGIVGGILSARAPAPTPAMAGGYPGSAYPPGQPMHTPPPGQQPPPPAQHASPACTQCGAPANWVQQYQRWYCGQCRVYL